MNRLEDSCKNKRGMVLSLLIKRLHHLKTGSYYPFCGAWSPLVSTCCSVDSSSMFSGVQDANSPSPKIATINRVLNTFIILVVL